MKNIIKSVAVLLLCAFSFSASGGIIDKADSAYNEKNYKEAIELYNQIIEEKGQSAGLLYNLGNAYYLNDNDGQALLCYERALKLKPGDKQIKSNIAYVKSKVNDRNRAELGDKGGNVMPDEPSFMENVYAKIAIDHDSDMWAVLGVIAFGLFLFGIALYTFTPNVLARKTGFFSAIVFLFFTLFFLFSSYSAARYFNTKDKAVLLEYTSELLETPLDGAPAVSTPLHRGTEVEILEEKNGNDGAPWFKVRLNSDKVGWVKSEYLEVI